MATAILTPANLNGSNGFVINGVVSPSFFGGGASGYALSAAGDINGDGLDDLLVGGSQRFYSNPQSNSYVIFGADDLGATGSLNLANLNGSNGFVLLDPGSIPGGGYTYGTILFGTDLRGGGDINGDGFADIVVGAPGLTYMNYGRTPVDGAAYVIFGGTGLGASGSVNPLTLNGSDGFTFEGNGNFSTSDFLGSAVDITGDFNGDGFAELVVGAKYNYDLGNRLRSAGEVYVVFGGPNVGTSGPINRFNLNGSNGFVIEGLNASDLTGGEVVNAGDLNHDGIDDLAISAEGGDPNGVSNAGKTYVVFGTTNLGTTGSISLGSLNGTNGFVIHGVNAGDLAGVALGEAGDMNGDGIDDLIVGALGADPNGSNGAGASYVVFGSTTLGGTGVLELSSLNGTHGFVINGIDSGDISGASVAGGGDINGDGLTDLLIGAQAADPNGVQSAGESYVVFGRPGLGATGALDLSTLDGTNGFTFQGLSPYDNASMAIAWAGDLNNDGVDDIAVGAPFAGPNTAGESYVIFGNRAPALDLNGLTTPGLDQTVPWYVGNGSVPLTDSSVLELTDNGDRLVAATVTLTNPLDGIQEVLTVNTSGTNIVATYQPTLGVLSLTGNDTLTNYETVLGTLRYDNLDLTPTLGNRVVEWVVDDGGDVGLTTSAVAIATVTTGFQVVGTANPDTLVGSAGDDLIIGLGGFFDTLIGGAGADTFLFQDVADRGDLLVGFTPGTDRIDLRNVFAQLNLAVADYTDARNQGYLTFGPSPFALGGTVVYIDPTQGGLQAPLVNGLLLAAGVTEANLDNPANFIVV